MGVTCDPECAEWAKAFDDCVCTDKDLVSFTLGILSVLFFANCFLPQIALNFVNRSSEGLSVGMILVWSLGDLCNLTGVLLTGALPTQFMMAILFCTCDSTLNFQNLYYTYWSTPKRLTALQQKEWQHHSHVLAAEASELEALLAITSTDAKCDMTALPARTNRSGSSSTSSSLWLGTLPIQTDTPTDRATTRASEPTIHKLRKLSAGLLLLSCGMLTTGLPLILTAGVTGGLPGGSNHYSRDRLAGFGQIEMANMLHSDGSTAAPDPGKMSAIFGSVLGWVMTCSYVGSRIPQLVKNYRRGTTTGVSLPMFVLLVLGSTTYVASIFVRSTAKDFVVPKLPWLLEALGSAVLDFSIVCQILYFRHKNLNHPAAAAAVPPGAGAASL